MEAKDEEMAMAIFRLLHDETNANVNQIKSWFLECMKRDGQSDKVQEQLQRQWQDLQPDQIIALTYGICPDLDSLLTLLWIANCRAIMTCDHFKGVMCLALFNDARNKLGLSTIL